MASTNAAATSGAETAKPKAAVPPSVWYVIDTTAQPDSYVGDKIVSGARVHEQIVDGRVKQFRFEQGKALEMPKAIAIKFLRDPAFLLTDKEGKPIPYERAPKQPEELGAGERLVLKDNETIARYEELHTHALLQRAVELTGGEKFAKGETKPERADLIAFIVTAKAEARKATLSKESDRKKSEFDPGADDTLADEDDFEDAA